MIGEDKDNKYARPDRVFTPVHASSGIVGFLGGLAAAIYGYTLVPSLPLALFVFGTVSYLVGRALPPVITKPLRLQRTF